MKFSLFFLALVIPSTGAAYIRTGNDVNANERMLGFATDGKGYGTEAKSGKSMKSLSVEKLGKAAKSAFESKSGKGFAIEGKSAKSAFESKSGKGFFGKEAKSGKSEKSLSVEKLGKFEKSKVVNAVKTAVQKLQKSGKSGLE